jgi:type I restriction enzyme S subunit
MNTNALITNFRVLVEASGGIDRVREAILELATSGKLVDQDENEINRGFTSMHGPHPLPSSWVWTSLEEIASYGGNGNVSPSKIKPSDWVLDLEDIEKGSSRLIEKVTARVRPTKSNKAKFLAGDVLYGKLRPYLDKVLIADSDGYCTTEIVPISPKQGIEPAWLRISLKSPRFLSYVNEKSYGMKMPRLGTKDALLSLHSVPPLSEQKRIIAKVDVLMTICDELELQQEIRDNLQIAARKSAIDAISTATTPEELETAWKRINNNWELIADTPESVNSLRELVLDLSVRGDFGTDRASKGFVPTLWDPSELKLDAEKLWQLDTMHAIPAMGWSRLPLARLGTWGSGGTPTATRKEFYNNGSIPWAVIGDLNNGIMTETASKITEKALSSSSTKLIPRNAVLIAMYGASIGKTAVAGIECTTNQAIAHCIVDESVISTEYFFLVAKSLKRHLIKVGKGAAQPNISQTVLKHLLIDVPELNVQQIVVSKVSQLMSFCDQLEAQLKVRRELAEKFTRSVVSAA